MSEWFHINTIEMLVVKAEYNFNLINNLKNATLSCQLLNIARGRCEVSFLKSISKKLDKKLFISSKKAFMKVDIELSEEPFNNLINTFLKYRYQTSKKIKITIIMEESVATNSDGILSLDQDLTTNLKNIDFNIPIF